MTENSRGNKKLTRNVQFKYEDEKFHLILSNFWLYQKRIPFDLDVKTILLQMTQGSILLYARPCAGPWGHRSEQDTQSPCLHGVSILVGETEKEGMENVQYY